MTRDLEKNIARLAVREPPPTLEESLDRIRADGLHTAAVRHTRTGPRRLTVAAALLTVACFASGFLTGRMTGPVETHPIGGPGPAPHRLEVRYAHFDGPAPFDFTQAAEPLFGENLSIITNVIKGERP